MRFFIGLVYVAMMVSACSVSMNVESRPIPSPIPSASPSPESRLKVGDCYYDANPEIGPSYTCEHWETNCYLNVNRIMEIGKAHYRVNYLVLVEHTYYSYGVKHKAKVGYVYKNYSESFEIAKGSNKAVCPKQLKGE